MSTRDTNAPRYAAPTRVDVTGCPTADVTNRVSANRVAGSEVHLERRGGRTFLVATPTGRSDPERRRSDRSDLERRRSDRSDLERRRSDQ